MRLALVAAAALLVAGCAAPDAAEEADVLATFYPLAWAAERLVQTNLTVATLVPRGVEPHDWEPSTFDVSRLGAAEVLLVQGAGFEPWIGDLVANLGTDAPRVVDTTSGLPLIEGEETDQRYDPHTWLDPVLFAEQVRVVQAALVETFPEHRAAIDARGDQLVANLGALHADFADVLSDCETRVIIANHDAYSYLASRYDLEVVAISGLSPESEPSPEDISRAVEAARAHNVTIIFFEELVSPRVAEVVAQEVGAQTRVLTPLESKPQEGDYISRMQVNLLHLREAMRCT